MANTHRGEVPLTIGGRSLTLKLTLGGLAELEHALGAGDLAGLGERLASASGWPRAESPPATSSASCRSA
jgi:hypothetical protein